MANNKQNLYWKKKFCHNEHQKNLENFQMTINITISQKQYGFSFKFNSNINFTKSRTNYLITFNAGILNFPRMSKIVGV